MSATRIENVKSRFLLVFCQNFRFSETKLMLMKTIHFALVIVIVISRFPKRYEEAKRTRAPAYSRALPVLLVLWHRPIVTQRFVARMQTILIIQHFRGIVPTTASFFFPLRKNST